MTTFVLVPGMWLGAWAWRDVTARLRAAGHDVYPLTLTGLADRRHLGGPQVDLDTHTTDITALIEAEELTDVVLAGHSYGGYPVTGAGDKVPRVLVASTFPVDEVRALIAQGHPWFAGLGDARLIGVPTGHWPMLSEPAALADALGAL